MEPKNLVSSCRTDQRDIAGSTGSDRYHAEHRCIGGARDPFHNAYTPADLRAARAAPRPDDGCTRLGRGQRRALSRRSNDLHHRLRNGHSVVSIGKLHFRATEDDNGFSEEILPLHVLDGIGDLIGMLREPPANRGTMPALAESAGPGIRLQ